LQRDGAKITTKSDQGWNKLCASNNFKAEDRIWCSLLTVLDQATWFQLLNCLCRQYIILDVPMLWCFTVFIIFNFNKLADVFSLKNVNQCPKAPAKEANVETFALKIA